MDDKVYFVAKQKVFFSFSEYYIPKKLITKSLASIEKDIQTEQKKKKRLSAQLKELAKNHWMLLTHEERRLSKHLAVIDAKKQFSRGEHLSILSGFIPEAQNEELKGVLLEELNMSYELILEEPEDAPIKFNHKRIVFLFKNQMYQ